VSINRSLVGPVTFALVLAATACGAPRAASTGAAAGVAAGAATGSTTPLRPTVTSSATENGVTSAIPTAELTDLTAADRSLDEVDAGLRDLEQALTQTQEGDVDQ
jgi:hypothetical protein